MEGKEQMVPACHTAPRAASRTASALPWSASAVPTSEVCELQLFASWGQGRSCRNTSSRWGLTGSGFVVYLTSGRMPSWAEQGT